MIVNIRGTSGSGKSTIVRAIRDSLSWSPEHTLGRKQPICYRCVDSNHNGHEIVIPGHYETQCGGCDTIKNQAFVQEFIRSELKGITGVEAILYEGLLLSEESKRTIELVREFGDEHVVIHLTTPVELCIERINARRRAKDPDAKPVNESNTRNRVRVIQRACDKIVAVGGRVEHLSDGDALCRVRTLLDLSNE